MMHRSPNKDDNVSPDELGRAIAKEVTEGLKGIRGRKKRREFINWAKDWWKQALNSERPSPEDKGGKE